MNKPLITIITVSFNCEKTIKDTIESVLNQTYNNIEYIIVDGNSKDKTVSIIQSYEQKFKEININYIWISEKDTGIYNAFNKGLQLAKGNWISFIGADDVLKDHVTIENIVPYLINAKKNNIRFVYGKIEHVNSNNDLIETLGNPWQKQKKKFLDIMNVGHSGSFNHRSLFSEQGKFDESFKIAGDYEFLLREFKNQLKEAFFINKVIIVMKEGGISSSLTNRLTLVKETKKARIINEIYSFSPELFFWELKVRAILAIKSLFGLNFASKTADIYRKILGKNKRWS